MAKRISKKIQNEDVKESSTVANVSNQDTENEALKKVDSPAKVVRIVKRTSKKSTEPVLSEQRDNSVGTVPLNNNSQNTEDNKKQKRNSVKKIKKNAASESENPVVNNIEPKKNSVQKKTIEKKTNQSTKQKNIPQEKHLKVSNEVLQDNENTIRNKRVNKGRKAEEAIAKEKEWKNIQETKPKDTADSREIGADIKTNVHSPIRKQQEQNTNRNQNQQKRDNNLKNRHEENKRTHERNDIPVKALTVEQQQSVIAQQQSDVQNNEQRRKKKRRNKKGKNRAELQENRIEVAEQQAPNQSKQQQILNQPKQHHQQKQNNNKQVAHTVQKNDKRTHPIPINKMGGKHVPALLEKPQNKTQEQTAKISDVKEVPISAQKQKERTKSEANKSAQRFEEKAKKNIKETNEEQNKQVPLIESKSSEKSVVKNQEKQANKQKHQKHLIKEESEQLQEPREEKKPDVKNEKEGKGERNEQIVEQKQKHYDSGKSYIPIPLPQPIALQKKNKSRHRAPQPLKIGSYSEFALSIIEKVENFLLKSISIPDGSSILLAVSGGVDSIVMADIFSYISSKHDFEVQVAHINHNLRGKESDDDERSVKGFCKRCGLRFHSARIQVKEYAKKNKISIETAARNLRYNSLDKQARSCAAEYVATAHTADDAAETFLFNVFRGAGITGLSGIPSERPLSKKINLMRPLLSLRKDEIVEYAKNRGLFWREDSSNTSLLYTRNKIRLKLLPHLRELFGNSVVEVVNRTATLMQGVDQVMQDLLDIFIPKNVQQVEYGAFSISLIGLKTQADFIKGEIFQSVLVHKMNQSNQPMATIQRIIDLCDADVNTIADVNGQVIALRERDSIVLSKRKKVFEYYKGIFPDMEIVEKEWIVRLTTLQKRPKEWTNNPLIEYLDADLLPKQLTLRSWRNGDKFQPLGMQGHTSVSDFLTNIKVKALDRKKTLVLCAGTEIIWVLGKRISEQFRVKQSTQKIIQAELIHKNQNETEEK